jgi:hypothetical protein
LWQDAPMGHVTARLEASHAFRRLMLIAALVLAALELAVFVIAWRLGVLFDPSGDPHASALFVALGTVLTLQAMVVVGLGWLLVAMVWTTLEFDEEGLALEHPWRRWRGAWHQVRRAWHRGGWLTIETAGSARRWHVRAAPADARVAAFRGSLAGDVWLDGRALTAHLAVRFLPLALAAVALAAIVLWVIRALDGR